MKDIVLRISRIAKEAGQKLMTHFSLLGQAEVFHKGRIDLVTVADQESESYIKEALHAAYPEIGFHGEEGGGSVYDQGRLFVADPLDGTTNFVHGLPLFCVSIAYVVDGQPQAGVVYAPYFDEFFWAAKGEGAWHDGRRIHVSTTAMIECAYDNLTTARFNMKDFDVEVNGHKKADIHGQGYCSYLNTIVALTFRRYMETYAKYNPGFVVIDTPLLGLDQGVNDAAPESMRTALFKYFISHQSDGQIIILENMMHIPVLDYEGAGANVITFTKGLEVGRYGFLNDVK